MRDRKLKTIFLVSSIFSGKADRVTLLGFECTKNPENLKSLEPFLRKSIFFFSCELLLILGVVEKLNKKTGRDIYKRTPDIEFERDRSIGLGSMIGDGQADRQTDRQTHTHTHIFFF